MKQNFYISAAIELGVIADAVGYGYDSENNVIVLTDGSSTQEITTAIETKATHLMNLDHVRQHRDRLLQKTDWWASSDLTMSAEKTAYRQALRDITSQVVEGQELDITWPDDPTVT